MFIFHMSVMGYVVNSLAYNIRNAWSGFWNRDKVMIQDIRRYYKEDGKVMQEDVTEEATDLIDRYGSVNIGEGTEWIELRYTLNGHKYRIVSDDVLRYPSTYYPRNPKHQRNCEDDDCPAFKYFMAGDVDTGEDYTDRFLKFAGPFRDFFGRSEIPIQWFFPNRDFLKYPAHVILVTGSKEVSVIKDKYHPTSMLPSL